MAKLVIDTGVESLEIVNKNGELLGYIKYVPSDMAFFKRVNELKDNLKSILESSKKLDIDAMDVDEVIAKLDDMDTQIKAEVNKCFDDDVSAVVFGNVSSLTMKNNVTLLERFLNSILPVIIKDFEKEQKASEARVSKYTKEVK